MKLFFLQHLLKARWLPSIYLELYAYAFDGTVKFGLAGTFME